MFPIVIIFAILHDLRTLLAMAISLAFLLVDYIVRIVGMVRHRANIAAVSVVDDIMCLQIRCANPFTYEMVCTPPNAYIHFIVLHSICFS